MQKKANLVKAHAAWKKSYVFQICNAHLGGDLGDRLIDWTEQGLPVREIQDRLRAEECPVGLATVWRWVSHLERA